MIPQINYDLLKSITNNFHEEIDKNLTGVDYGFFMNKREVKSYYTLSCQVVTCSRRIRERLEIYKFRKRKISLI